MQYFDPLRLCGFRIFDEKNQLIHYELAAPRTESPHYRNFVDCIRSRKAPNADVAIGHVSNILVHLGNIATRTRRTLRFDPDTETILNDPDASRYLTREYRDHWSSRPFT